jgi:hypothetical protein
MNDRIDREWRDVLQWMTPDEKRAFLGALRRVRADCIVCPVKRPKIHRDPCYTCLILPDCLGQPKSTVN